MADKLIWTELRRVLATRAGVSQKQAGDFLAALQTQMIEALKQDKSVRVNGLGTFKLQAVAPRKSVNIQTGEEIVIEGYNKVVFVPEASVKELVEKAGNLGGTAEALQLTEDKEAVDPIKKLGAQAEEIVDILGELGQSPKDEEKPEEPKKAKSAKEKPSTKKTAKKEVEPEVPEVQEVPVVQEVADTPETPEAPYVPEAPEDKPKKRYHFVRDTLICVVILLLLLLVGYFFLRQQLSGWIDSLTNPQPAQTEQVAEVQEVQEVPKVSEVEEVPEWTYEGLLLTENITPGSRLAWIAKKHYGDKVYWPYLYAANKDRLKHPSQITVGTPIRVPKLTAADRDTTSAQFIRVRKDAEKALQGNW